MVKSEEETAESWYSFMKEKWGKLRGDPDTKGEDYDSCVRQVMEDGESEQAAHAICSASTKAGLEADERDQVLETAKAVSDEGDLGTAIDRVIELAEFDEKQIPDNAMSITSRDEAPEGAQVVEGERGGLYYVPGGGDDSEDGEGEDGEDEGGESDTPPSTYEQGSVHDFDNGDAVFIDGERSQVERTSNPDQGDDSIVIEDPETGEDRVVDDMSELDDIPEGFDKFYRGDRVSVDGQEYEVDLPPNPRVDENNIVVRDSEGNSQQIDDYEELDGYELADQGEE